MKLINITGGSGAPTDKSIPGCSYHRTQHHIATQCACEAGEMKEITQHHIATRNVHARLQGFKDLIHLPSPNPNPIGPPGSPLSLQHASAAMPSNKVWLRLRLVRVIMLGLMLRVSIMVASAASRSRHASSSCLWRASPRVCMGLVWAGHGEGYGGPILRHRSRARDAEGDHRPL